MARPLRIEFEGAFYHMMARGNARQDIFLDDADRQRFIDNLGRVAQRFDWTVWAWCLMDNCYHLKSCARTDRRLHWKRLRSAIRPAPSPFRKPIQLVPTRSRRLQSLLACTGQLQAGSPADNVGFLACFRVLCT